MKCAAISAGQPRPPLGAGAWGHRPIPAGDNCCGLATLRQAVRFAAGAEHQLHATPLSRRAAALHSLAQADGYVIVPPGPGIAAGTTVPAFLLRDR